MSTDEAQHSVAASNGEKKSNLRDKQENSMKRRVTFQDETEKETKKLRFEVNDLGDSSLDDNQSQWGNRMPPEILTQIFMEVTQTEGSIPVLLRLSQTCRLWRDVALSPQLWHTVDLSLEKVRKKHQNERKLLWLLKHRFLRVKNLSLSKWKLNSLKTAIEFVAENCLELRAINLSGCKNLPANALLNLVHKCPTLESIDLSGTWPNGVNPKSAVSISTLCEIFESMGERLKQLNLANNSIKGLGQIISLLSKNCPSLETLDLSNIRSEMGQMHLEQFQTGCPKLRTLHLTNSPIRLAAATYEQRAQAPGFPELEELSIAVDTKELTSMDDSALERILKNAHKLKLLDVRGCSSINSSSLIQIPAWDLKHLFLSASSATKSSSGTGLELVVKKWKHSLVELDLSWSTDTKSLDEAIFALVEEKNSVLRVLDLRGSSVSFEPVKKLLENSETLQVLNLSSCRALPRGIKRLYNNLNELEDLRREIRKGRFEIDHEEP